MVWTMVLLAAGIMLALALLMAYVLGWANKALHVTVDGRVERVTAALPGANCGGCGYAGCAEYAEAVVAGKAPPDKCPVGGESCARKIADILGIALQQSWPYRPVVHCGATYDQRLKRNEYHGERTCGSANLIAGVQGCTYGCLGFGDCQAACRFDAIGVIDGLAVVDYELCTGCGACAKACPRNIISMVPFKAESMVVVACSNKDPGRDVRAVCKVGCLGCGTCARVSDLFKIEDGLSRIDYDKYDPDKMEAVNIALDRCPMRRIVLVGEPSAKDLAAVAKEQLPEVVRDDFKTTVNKTEWRG
jgi:Na+-translocating ferredoxin:NAD+ oxidoreductase RNF subunit RnfB